MKHHRTPRPPASGWRISAAIVAIAAVFALKLAVLLQLHAHPLLRPEAGLDTAVYLSLAREVLRGQFALGPGLYFVPPLYVYFVSLLLWLSGSVDWVRVVQTALGAAAVAFVFRTADLWHGRRAAWFAGGLAALAGVFTFYEVLLLPAALDPFLAALSLYLLANALVADDSDRMKRTAVAAGAVFGAFALNRANVLLPVLAIALLLAVTRRRRAALLLAAGLIAALAPVLVRNYVVARDVTPLSSHGGLS